ncbi:MAG: hypothetical protein QGM50_11930 [Anaerolineae bacterium]|nr:hypothetical protein [Anaerolineae bacterium]
MPTPRLIALADRSVPREQAVEIFVAAMSDLGTTVDRAQALPQAVTLTYAKGRRERVEVEELLAEIERTGAAQRLHGLLRAAERSAPMAISTNIGAPGFKISVQTSPSTKVEVSGAGYVTTDVVADALEDTLYYREQVATLSDGVDVFRPCFRAFKAYLSSSITAIDATVNGHAFYSRQGSSLSESERKQLSRRNASLFDKLTKWIPILSGGRNLSTSAAYWYDYDEIRKARNAFTHVNSPTYRFAIAEAAQMLNLCRQGVGGLLLAVDECLGGKHPSPWVFRVARAPLASLTDSRATGADAG